MVIDKFDWNDPIVNQENAFMRNFDKERII